MSKNTDPKQLVNRELFGREVGTERCADWVRGEVALQSAVLEHIVEGSHDH
jgi:hypothetical protein